MAGFSVPSLSSSDPFFSSSLQASLLYPGASSQVSTRVMCLPGHIKTAEQKETYPGMIFLHGKAESRGNQGDREVWEASTEEGDREAEETGRKGGSRCELGLCVETFQIHLLRARQDWVQPYLASH